MTALLSSTIRTIQIKRVGCGAYCTTAADPSEPTAIANPGMNVLARVPWPLPSRSKSINAEDTAAVAPPEPMPCRSRATRRPSTPVAVRKVIIAATVTSSAATVTGRRPMWSERRPNTRSEASRAAA
jgi:hypothetical protein